MMAERLFKTGLVHVYYGDGQGKTTAAAGLAARVSGCGGKVLFAQFLKNGRSGELAALRELQGIDVLEPKPCSKFFYEMDERERQQAFEDQVGAFLVTRERVKYSEYDMLVLDEMLDVVDLGMITGSELVDFLKERPSCLEVVLTGHAVVPDLVEYADYVSEVKKVKHPYDKGVRARRGAEV